MGESEIKIPIEIQRLAKESTDSFQSLILQSTVKGSQGDKAKSILVAQFLLENYAAHPSNSIPRTIIYEHYTTFCQVNIILNWNIPYKDVYMKSNNIDPIGATSFGKLLRYIFPGLTTRRLGNRGSSKYHYSGIRLRNNNFQGAAGNTYFAPFCFNLPDQGESLSSEPNLLKVGDVLPKFNLSEEGAPVDLNIAELEPFMKKYRKLAEDILDKCQYFRLGDVEVLLKEFWLNVSPEEICLVDNAFVGNQCLKFDLLLYEVSLSI